MIVHEVIGNFSRNFLLLTLVRFLKKALTNGILPKKETEKEL
jgi:hypothetical protein